MAWLYFATSTILSLISLVCIENSLFLPEHCCFQENHLWYFAFALWNICFGMQQTSLSRTLKSTHQKHHYFPPFQNCTVLLRAQHQQQNTKHNCTVLLLRAQHQQQNTKHNCTVRSISNKTATKQRVRTIIKTRRHLD